jgi:hypothetical protein
MSLNPRVVGVMGVGKCGVRDEHQHHQRTRVIQYEKGMKVEKSVERSHFIWLEVVVLSRN